MALFVFSDFATTSLAAAASAGSTSLTLAPGTGALFPSPPAGQEFALVLNDLATRLKFEIVYCTARTLDVLTVVRGQEGTTAQAWSIGDLCWNGPTAGQIANAVQSPHMLDGSISPTFGNITSNGTIVGNGPGLLAIGAAGSGNNSRMVNLGDFTAGGSAIPGSGYLVLPNSWIFQWGVGTTSSGGTATVTYPLPFPTGVFGLAAVVFGDLSDSQPGISITWNPLDAAHFQLISYNTTSLTGPVSASYFCIGR